MAPCERNEQISDERKHVGYEHNVKAESRQTCTDMYAFGGNLIRDCYGLPRITRLHRGCSPRATPGATIRELLPKATPGATSRELPDYSRDRRFENAYSEKKASKTRTIGKCVVFSAFGFVVGVILSFSLDSVCVRSFFLAQVAFKLLFASVSGLRLSWREFLCRSPVRRTCFISIRFLAVQSGATRRS